LLNDYFVEKELMAEQNYQNHRKWYASHHFVFYPLAFGFLVYTIYLARKYPDKSIELYLVAVAIFLTTWLSFMLRQHYALILQNRMVRLEMRLRYFELFGKRFDAVEHKLTFKQIAALRFASDEELGRLIEATLAENLQPSDIKKSIQHWQADHMRV